MKEGDCDVRSDEPGTRELCRRFRQPAAQLTASGSAALEVALEILSIGEGDEVIIPDIGCHSVGAAVVRSGATAVFVGVGDGLTLQPETVAQAYSARTRAVIAVHQFGLWCDVPGIRAVLPEHVEVIEDMAQAWGLRCDGVPAGGHGTVAVTSFGPSKPLSLGAGGAVLGPADRLAGAVSTGDVSDRRLRRPPSVARFPMPLLAGLPDAIEAADRALAVRRDIVATFQAHDLARSLRLAPLQPGSEPSWTRIPVYPVEPLTDESCNRLVAAFGAVQRMHEVLPSKLPMFSGYPTVVVAGPPSVRKPLLIVPPRGYRA